MLEHVCGKPQEKTLATVGVSRGTKFNGCFFLATVIPQVSEKQSDI